MHARVRQNIRHKLWVGILLTGYLAVLFSHLILLPAGNGQNDVVNTRLVQVFGVPGAEHIVKKGCIKSKDSHTLHIRIYKHFQTEKWAYVLPGHIKLPCFNVALPKPLYYYSNHFVSSFLYVCAGRAPPAIA